MERVDPNFPTIAIETDKINIPAALSDKIKKTPKDITEYYEISNEYLKLLNGKMSHDFINVYLNSLRTPNRYVTMSVQTRTDEVYTKKIIQSGFVDVRSRLKIHAPKFNTSVKSVESCQKDSKCNQVKVNGSFSVEGMEYDNWRGFATAIMKNPTSEPYVAFVFSIDAPLSHVTDPQKMVRPVPFLKLRNRGAGTLNGFRGTLHICEQDINLKLSQERKASVSQHYNIIDDDVSSLDNASTPLKETRLISDEWTAFMYGDIV